MYLECQLALLVVTLIESSRFSLHKTMKSYFSWQGFLCSPGFPDTHIIDQAGLRLTKSDRFYLPGAEINGVHHDLAILFLSRVKQDINFLR